MKHIDWDRTEADENGKAYGLPTLPPAAIESVDIDTDEIRDYTGVSRIRVC